MSLHDYQRIEASLSAVADPVRFLINLFAHAPIGFAVWTADGRPLLTNKAFLDIFLVEPPPEYRVLNDELLAKSGLIPLFERAFAGESVQVPTFWYDPREHTTLNVTQGRRVAISMTLFPLFKPGGEIEYVAATYKDETEIMLANESLRVAEVTARHSRRDLEASEARFRHLFDSGIIGIMIADTAGNIQDANDEFLGLLGYSRADLEAGALRWADMTPPEWRALDDAAIAALARSGVARPWEKEYFHKDGRRVPVMVGVALVDSESGIAFVLDLSERKRAEEARKLAEAALGQAEEQLRQSQKMEAIGTLSGSIAHDFNNLLSVILGYVESLVSGLRSGDPMRADLQEVERAAKRAEELTRQLLAFSRRQILQPKVLDLNLAISEMARMLERIIGEDIELSFSPAPQLGAVYVDPGQIEQVLLNLVVNARDAMPKGGKLRIETSERQLEPAQIASEHLPVEPGRYIVLSVRDTGSGMDRATQARIFEPFFTTKDPGKGTGLGLSTVHGIVHQSGGHIRVHSALGVGATFEVYLPRQGLAPVASEREVPAISVRGSETILLVEDEEQVRNLLLTVLRRHGYRVLAAESGGDAVLICEQHPDAIHLLLTDVVMPRMSGRQLWERLAPLRPNMKVLFMSGYTDDAVVRHGIQSSELSFIQKPMSPAALLAKVRSVLDSKT